MGEKVAFDPSIHLIPEEERKPPARRLSAKANGRGRGSLRDLQETFQNLTHERDFLESQPAQPTEDEDEALARRLQEEMLLADRQAEEEDMALARQMQVLEEENNAHRSGGTFGGAGGATSGNGGRTSGDPGIHRSGSGRGILNNTGGTLHDDEALARQLQEDSMLLGPLASTDDIAGLSNQDVNDHELARRIQNFEHLGINEFGDTLPDAADSPIGTPGAGQLQMNGSHGGGTATNTGSRPSSSSFAPDSEIQFMLKIRQEQDDEMFARNLISSENTTGETPATNNDNGGVSSVPHSIPQQLLPPQQLLSSGGRSAASPITAPSVPTPSPEPFGRPRSGSSADRLPNSLSSGSNFPALASDTRSANPRAMDPIGMDPLGADPLGMDAYGMDLPSPLPSEKRRVHSEKKQPKENRRSSWRPHSTPLSTPQPRRTSSDDMLMGAAGSGPGQNPTSRPVPPAQKTRNQSNSSSSDSSVKSNQTMLSGATKKKKVGLFGLMRRRGSMSKDDMDDSHDGHQSSATDPVPPPPPNRRPGPLPNSVSVNRQVPISPQPQIGGKQVRKKTFGRVKPNQHTVPLCDVCGKPALSYLSTLDKKYHPECFKCMGCHTIIDPSGPFAFSVTETGEKFPLHRHCYAELFGIKCAVCKESIPTGPDGKVSYVKHPFFDTEQMCPRHASNPGRRCTGCHRFEPIGNGFADLGDANRCVCLSCCRTVIVDSEDAKPLWDKVIRFMEFGLGLPIWQDMRNVPVLVVGYDALNEQIQNTPHGGSSQIMTRGLCLSEHQSGKRIALHRMKFDRTNRSFIPRGAENKGYTYIQVPEASKINPDSSVTAILCLSGLPSDLTASVLAHEATHAWFKLHPSFDITKPIPQQVEEGCCQLMALLFLNDGLEPACSETSEGDEGPSDEKLRQYFKFSIETDENEIYGTGYRSAAKAFANIGIEALLSHVVLYREFPEV